MTLAASTPDRGQERRPPPTGEWQRRRDRGGLARSKWIGFWPVQVPGQPAPHTHHTHKEGAHMLKGWWPSEEKAKQYLEPSGWHQLEDGRWLSPGGLGHSEAQAIAIAQVRLALGYEDVTDVLTSEAFAQLVRRVVELEERHND